jgi:NitT/TauT family transport system substrate-binding protein
MSLCRAIACALAVMAGLVASAAQAASSLTVTEYGVAATSLPWGVARDQGLFKANGLEFDGIIGANGGGTAVRNMMASGLPFGEISTSGAIAAVQTGLDVIFIYSSNNNSGNMAWMTLPSSPVKTLADLKGRKAGFTNPRSTTETFLRIILHNAGLANDVTAQPTGGIAPGLTILNQGGVDAVPVDEPELYPEGKYRRVFYVRDYVPEATWTVGLTTRAFAQSHPEMVRKLVLVHRQAVDFMRSHIDDAAKTYAKDWQMDGGLAKRILHDLFAANYFSRGDFNMKALNVLASGLQMTGALAKPVDFDKLIDRSFLPADLR